MRELLFKKHTIKELHILSLFSFWFAFSWRPQLPRRCEWTRTGQCPVLGGMDKHEYVGPHSVTFTGKMSGTVGPATCQVVWPNDKFTGNFLQGSDSAMISYEALTESITKLSIIVCTDSGPGEHPEKGSRPSCNWPILFGSFKNLFVV